MEPVEKEKAKLSTTQKILIAGFAVIVVAVIVIGAVLLLRGSNTPDTAQVGGPAPGNVVIDEGNYADVIAELDRKAKEGMFEVKMNSSWTFPDGKSASTDASVANSSANHKPFYFEVSVGETEEIIYTSPKVPVGSKVTGFALTKDLDAGTYDCVCTYHLLNDDDTIATSASVTVTVVVEN